MYTNIVKTFRLHITFAETVRLSYALFWFNQSKSHTEAKFLVSTTQGS